MQETLQEYADARQTRLHVDRERSIIRGVKILGLRSRNGRVYLPAALASAVTLYEGAKVNINHPKGHPHSPRDYQDRIGTLRGVAVRDGEGLFGDLQLNPAHALTEQLLWDAQHAPENVGLSHNVQAQTARRGDEVVVEAILKVQAVDLVADPATTRGLFESATVGGVSASHSTDSQSAAIETRHGIADADKIDLPEAQASAIPLSTVEGADALAGQFRAERDALAAKVRRLQEEILRYERRELIRKLLIEHELPYPDNGHGASAATLVSRAFLESLMAADNESTVRELVLERANLVVAAREQSPAPAHGAGGWGRPRSREQQYSNDASVVTDAETFVRAIT